MVDSATMMAQVKASASAFASGTPTITLAANSILLGFQPQAVGNTVLSSLSATAPLMLLYPVRRLARTNENIAIQATEIGGWLKFGLPKDTVDTLANILGFVDALTSRLEAGTGMTGVVPPLCTWEVDESIFTAASPSVLTFKFGFDFIGCG